MRTIIEGLTIEWNVVNGPDLFSICHGPTVIHSLHPIQIQ